MFIKVPVVLMVLGTISAPGTGLAQPTPACPVTLVAQGVRGSQGSVGFVVYSSKDGWPSRYEQAFHRVATPARPGDIDVTIDMPPGRYGIAVLHDENANKRLDRKPSGRPREGFGLSNNPKVVLKTPSFASAAVDLTCGSRLLIRMQYPSRSADAGKQDTDEK